MLDPDSLEAPLNVLALLSIKVGIGSVFCLITVWCFGLGYFLSPIGVVGTLGGMVAGVLGLRHASIHGYGWSYAAYGILINGLCNLLYSAMSVALMATVAAGVMG